MVDLLLRVQELGAVPEIEKNQKRFPKAGKHSEIYSFS